jgi:serine/threonine protein kinase
VANDLVGGRYRLEERLGIGGMSEVWAAEDTELGRRVAIKILGRDADAARFNREARAVAALAHPNICQLYDFGQESGRPFMVLEYLGGGTLEDRLVTGDAFPDDETRRLAREIASALAHAHGRGLVHRDLKPANVLFDEEGRAKIADFGIARLSGAGTLTEAGTLMGTAAYISPEQATGQSASPASDVYSFGVILYRLLTGKLPFEAGTALELAELHVRAEPPPLGALRPDAPRDLAAVAEAAIAKDPTARPADGAALGAMLASDETAATVLAPAAATEATVVIPRARPARRGAPLPLIVAAVLALAAAGIGVAVIATRSSDSAPGRLPTSAAVTTRRHRTTAAATSAPPPTTRPTQATTRATTTRATTRSTTTAPNPPPTPAPTPPPPTTAPPPTTVATVTTPITTTTTPTIP